MNCNKCGWENPENSVYCIKCGGKIDAINPPSADSWNAGKIKAEMKRNMHLWIMIGIAIIGVVMAIFLQNLVDSEKNEGKPEYFQEK